MSLDVKRGKLIHIEILRIMCIFFVMFNHTTPMGYLSFVGQDNVVLYYSSMALSVLCKIAVPVFFMISGALLLGKEETFGELFKKRILKMFIILIVVSVPYYILNNFGRELSLVDFFAKLYTDSTTTALWYLYSYIGFLLMLPVLRKLIKELKAKEYKYIFFVHIVFALVTSIIDCVFFEAGSINPSVSMAMILDFNIFFPLMGYYIEHVVKDSQNSLKTRIIAAVSMVASIIVTCVITQIYIVRRAPVDYNIYESFFNCLIAIPAFSIYFILKGITRIDAETIGGRIISQLGGAVFGVYLIEKVLRIIASPLYDIFSSYIGDFGAIIIKIFGGLSIGFSVICLLRNIPFVGKYIRKWL